MPEMTSMKIKKKKGDDSLVGENPYGYGLSLHFDHDRLQKLNMDKPLPVGTKVKVMAVATVESASEHQDTKGKRQSMSLQITDLALMPNEEKKDNAEILFGGDA